MSWWVVLTDFGKKLCFTVAFFRFGRELCFTVAFFFFVLQNSGAEDHL